MTSITRPPPRGRGRRPASAAALDRTAILACGLRLAETTPLQEISIVRVAAALAVTPATIHYHLKGRGALTAGIVNLFFHEMMAAWPQPVGRWRDDLAAVARAIYRRYRGHPGIAAYFASQNRFSILIPATEHAGGEALFRFLDAYFAAVAAVGLEPRRTATFAVILIQFIFTTAHATASRHLPGEQAHLRDYIERLDPARFPSIARMREGYLTLAGDEAFDAGLDLILAGLELERRGPP